MKSVKESKKTILIFILIVLCGAVVGFFSGRFSDKLGELNLSLSMLSPTVWNVIIYGFMAVAAVFLIAAFTMYFKLRGQAKAWDGEDEGVIDNIEYKLNYPLIIANILMILNFLWFALSLAVLVEVEDAIENPYNVTILAVLLGFVAILVAILVITVLVVNLEKSLNPEKEGSVLEMKFAKKWEDSSDEAEKIKMYKTGYIGYKAANYTCIALWLIGFLCQIGMGTGIMPVVFVSIIWLVMTVACNVAAMKLEKVRRI